MCEKQRLNIKKPSEKIRYPQTRKYWIIESTISLLLDILKIRRINSKSLAAQFKEKWVETKINIEQLIHNASFNIIVKLLFMRYNIEIRWIENLERAFDKIRNWEKVMFIAPHQWFSEEAALILLAIYKFNPELYNLIIPILRIWLFDTQSNILKTIFQKFALLSQQSLVTASEKEEFLNPDVNKNFWLKSSKSILRQLWNTWNIVFLFPEWTKRANQENWMLPLWEWSVWLIKHFAQNWWYIVNCFSTWLDDFSEWKTNFVLNVWTPVEAKSVLNLPTEKMPENFESLCTKRLVIQTISDAIKELKKQWNQYSKQIRYLKNQLQFIDKHRPFDIKKIIFNDEIFESLPENIKNRIINSTQTRKDWYYHDIWAIWRFMAKDMPFQKQGVYETINDIGTDIEREQDTKTYNKHYHDQHIKNWIPKNKLIKDDPMQILYSRDPWTLSLREKLVMEFINWFWNIIWDPNYEHNIRQLFEDIKKWKSILIITNHTTFLNFPIIIMQLHIFAQKYWYENILNDVYTILWPALVTQSQKNYILSISNLLKTIPNTPNSTIPWLKKLIDAIRKRFLKTLTTLKKWKSDHSSKWKIFILAPTGTRDTIIWWEWEAKKIYFEWDQTPSVAWSLAIVKSFAKDNLPVYIFWVNESSLKDPGKVNPTNNEWTPWDIHIWTQRIDPEETMELLKNQIFMQQLANNVKKWDWSTIWEIRTSQEISKIKSKNIYVSNPAKQRKYKFPDNFRKKFMRRVFHILKNIKKY